MLLHAGMDSSEMSCNRNCAVTLPRIERGRAERGSFLSAGTSFSLQSSLTPVPAAFQSGGVTSAGLHRNYQRTTTAVLGVGTALGQR